MSSNFSGPFLATLLIKVYHQSKEVIHVHGITVIARGKVTDVHARADKPLFNIHYQILGIYLGMFGEFVYLFSQIFN